MDERLQKLRREVEAAPADQELAARYENALQRAGEDGARVERYRFKFLCPLQYEDLTETGDVKIRACSECKKTVHQVASATELREEVAAGRCVAVRRKDLDGVFLDLADDAQVHAAQEPERACVVGAEYGWIDIDLASMQDETLQMANTFPLQLAEQLHVCPVRTTAAGALVVATPRPSLELADWVKKETGREVELLRAWPQAIERALDRVYPYRNEVMLMGDIAPADDLLEDMGWA